MADNKKIIIADSDKKVVTSLKGVLKDKGYDVIVSHDGATTLNKALSEMPAIIVLSISLPTIDGIKLSQILRSNPRMEVIPLIFLSESDIHIPHFQRHKDFLFIKPINVDEVSARVYSVFDRLEKTLEVSKEGKIIEGALSEVSLPDLLQMFSMNRKDGRLTLTKGKGIGDVWIRDGNIIDAAIGEIGGEKALFRLLAWKTGIFKFQPTKVNVPQKINRPTDNLIMEGLRQYDEWESLKDKFPPMDARLKVLIDPSTLPKGLRPVTQEIFLMLEFHPKVSDIIDRNIFPDYEIMRTIMTLLAKGIIGVTKEKGEAQIPILSREDILKLKEKINVRRNYKLDKGVGKVLVFSSDNDRVKYLINAVNALPEFYIHKDFLKGMGPTPYLGSAGHLRLSDNIEVTFIIVPLSEVFSPLWRPLSNDMLCGLTILNGEADRWDEMGKIVRYYQGKLGRPMAFVIPDGTVSQEKVKEEVQERLNIKNNVMLFPVIKKDSEGVYNMLKTLFRSVVGAP